MRINAGFQLMLPPSHLAARDIAEQIAASGGIITLPGVPLIRQLVGQLRWGGDHSVFWFTAFGDGEGDAHALRFDEIQVHPVGVCFVDRSGIVAFMAPIEKAAVEDPEDYRVAWKLWQEVVPMRQKVISDALIKLAARQCDVRYPPARAVRRSVNASNRSQMVASL